MEDIINKIVYAQVQTVIDLDIDITTKEGYQDLERHVLTMMAKESVPFKYLEKIMQQIEDDVAVRQSSNIITVRELIEQLQALSDEEQNLPVWVFKDRFHVVPCEKTVQISESKDCILLRARR